MMTRPLAPPYERMTGPGLAPLGLAAVFALLVPAAGAGQLASGNSLAADAAPYSQTTGYTLGKICSETYHEDTTGVQQWAKTEVCHGDGTEMGGSTARIHGLAHPFAGGTSVQATATVDNVRLRTSWGNGQGDVWGVARVGVQIEQFTNGVLDPNVNPIRHQEKELWVDAGQWGSVDEPTHVFILDAFTAEAGKEYKALFFWDARASHSGDRVVNVCAEADADGVVWEAAGAAAIVDVAVHGAPAPASAGPADPDGAGGPYAAVRAEAGGGNAVPCTVT